MLNWIIRSIRISTVYPITVQGSQLTYCIIILASHFMLQAPSDKIPYIIYFFPSLQSATSLLQSLISGPCMGDCYYRQEVLLLAVLPGLRIYPESTDF